MRISATNGSAMTSSLARWREDAEQRDDEIDAEIRLEVVVRLAAANRRNRLWGHRNRIRAGVVDAGSAGLCHNGAGRARGVPLIRRGQERMAVRRNLRHRERDRLDAAGLRQDEAVALVERKASAQVGE